MAGGKDEGRYAQIKERRKTEGEKEERGTRCKERVSEDGKGTIDRRDELTLHSVLRE
jgi:hypothetical protein